MKNSIKTALCGIVTALSLVFMFLGGVIFLFVYIMPMISGFLMIMLRKTFGISCAVITYVATSILSVILVPERECMLMYILFFGFYPILYPTLQKIKLIPLRLILKLAIFNISMDSVQALLVFVFSIPLLESGEGIATLIVFAVLMNLLFIVYDNTIKKLSLLYDLKLEKRIKKYFK